MLTRYLVVGAWFCLVVTSVACDTANKSRFAATLTSTGAVEIIFNPCPARSRAHDVYVEPKGVLEPLWHITSDGESDRRTFVIGMTPPEYREVVPLTEPLPTTIVVALTNEPDGRLKSSVDAEQIIVADLRVDTVLVPGKGQMSRESFLESDTCD